jgi:phosphohistidine swiveling domain-containing protein
MRGQGLALLGGTVVVQGLPSRQHVVHLGGTGHPVDLVGGKAASLDLLARLGVPVPPAVALTTAAYEDFVFSGGVTPLLDDIAARPLPEPWEITDEFKEIETAFLDAPMSEAARGALSETWAAVSGRGALAVRSSATTEDLADASFAGQHLSVLGVTSEEELEDAVRKVWASLWHPASRAYRTRLGVPTDRLAMPVIVQTLVPAELSGVAFTTDPTAPGLIRVEAVEGLGEALVSGQVTPEVYRLTSPGLHPVGDTPVPAIVRKVARIALDIAARLGAPQDVEWSVVGSRIWILQSRPITTLEESGGDGFDTPLRPDDLYTPVGVAEMLPGVLSPLLWTINGPLVEDGFRRLLDGFGALPAGLAGPHALVARHNGRAVLNLSLLRDASKQATGDSGAEVERQYLGHALTDEDAQPARLKGTRALLSALKGARVRRRAEEEGESFEAAVGAVVGLQTDLSSLTTHELLAYRSRVRDLAASGIAAEAAVAAAAAASYRSLEVMLESWMGAAGREWTQRITRSNGSAVVDPISVAAEWLEQLGVGPDELARLGLVTGAATPRAARDEDDIRLAQLAERLDRLGSSDTYAGPTWGERLDYLVPLVLRSSREPVTPMSTADDLRALVAELTRSWRWRTQRILTGQIVDMRIRMLRRLTDETRLLLQRRETVKAAVLRLGGRERGVIRVLAERLVAIGALTTADDIELMADWEIDDVLLGKLTLSRNVLAARKRALDRYGDEAELPALVNSQRVTAAPDSSDEITGWGASPGVHRGRVRVAFDLQSAASLQPGEVLVSPATDPSWTPLLMIAGAIVVERGGPLSHAAIVSRELGVPAVLNVSGATQVLRSGDVVEVDGSTGTITVLDEKAA